MNCPVVRVTNQDSLALAELIYQSDAQLYDWVFAATMDAREAIGALIKEEEGLFSRNNMLVAMNASRVEGVMLFYVGDSVGKRVECTIGHARTCFDVASASAIGVAMNELMRTFPALPPHALYLQNLAVSREMRRHGLGSALFKACIGMASRQGLARTCLDVSASNREAIAFYSSFAPLSGVEYSVPGGRERAYIRLVFRCD